MSILQSKLTLLLALLVGVLTLATPAQAIPVSGSFSIGGSSAVVAASFLDFVCNGSLGLACPAATGNFLVTQPATGSFAGLLGSTGLIKSLSQTIAPVNQTFSLPSFITFTGGDIALDLTFIFTGVGGQAACGAPAAAGQTCTPMIPALVTAANPMGLSPFTLQNTQTGSTASFSVGGTARRISTGETSTFTGVFTEQFNQFYQELLPIIAAGGSIENSYSATFVATVTPVPEATSITMLVGGLLLVGGLVRRRL